LSGLNDFTTSVKQVIETTNLEEINLENLATLVVFEFGRHVFPRISEDERTNMTQKILKDLLSGSSRPLVWISLDRFWATRHAKGLAFSLTEDTNPSRLFKAITDIEQPKSLTRELGQSGFYRLDLDTQAHRKDALRVAFSCSPQNEICASFEQRESSDWDWDIINVPIEQFLKNRGEENNTEFMLPWAYVMEVLHILGRIYPKDFFDLRVLRPDSPQQLDNFNLIKLPTKPPEINELQQALATQDWKNPKLIVARCLAALLSNQRMAFGNRQQIFKVLKGDVDEEIIEKWKEVAQWVATKNQHFALDRYLQIFLTPKLQIETQRPLIKASTGQPQVQARIAGFDIGASYIKVAIYEYDLETDTLGKTMLNGCNSWRTRF
jgi:hypothetical protein